MKPHPTPPPPPAPTHCRTCGQRLCKWGWRERCRAALERDIARVAKKFPRQNGGGVWS